MTDVKEAAGQAKAALDKIKIKKEKVGEGKDAHEVSKLENHQELDAALNEAKTHLGQVGQPQPQAFPTKSLETARVAIDKIAMVRGNPEHVQAAVDEAKAKLDQLVKDAEPEKKA
jgi:hypothetical protein